MKKINKLNKLEEFKKIVTVELNIAELHELSEFCLKLASEIEDGNSMIGGR